MTTPVTNCPTDKLVLPVTGNPPPLDSCEGGRMFVMRTENRLPVWFKDAFMKLYEAQPTISIPMRKPSSLKSKFISGPL